MARTATDIQHRGRWIGQMLEQVLVQHIGAHVSLHCCIGLVGKQVGQMSPAVVAHDTKVPVGGQELAGNPTIVVACVERICMAIPGVGIAAGEFVNHALHGTSIEVNAHDAGVTQPTCSGCPGPRCRSWRRLVGAAFDRLGDGVSQAAKGARALSALALMGEYHEVLAQRTTLLLQLQGFAVYGDSVRGLVGARDSPTWWTWWPIRQVWTR